MKLIEILKKAFPRLKQIKSLKAVELAESTKNKTKTKFL